MTLRFLSFEATDTVRLPALLYEPATSTSKVVIWLHGMGDNATFYKPHFMNPIGEALSERGVALFAMNNRGAHNRKTLKLVDESLPEEDQQYLGGTHHELIVDCIKDIDGAVAFLRTQGYSEFYLLGHSTGANKICAYHFRKRNNPFRKYVLAGPGDDSGIAYTELGATKFWRAIDYAQNAIESGDPHKIMPRFTGMYPFSAQSAHDILHPDEPYNTFPFFEATTKRLGNKPLFEEYASIDRPMLVIFGEQDEYTFTAGGTAQALNLLLGHTNLKALKKSDFQTIPNANHSFQGAEAAFAQAVAEWISHE